MTGLNRLALMATGAALLVSCFVSTQDAEARRFFARGANGAAGGYALRNANGAGAGAAALGQNAGAGFHAGSWAGANGSLQSAGGFGYKRGVGAFRNAGWSGKLSNGASGSGYTKNQYNAQTGQGVRSSSEQVQSAAGKDYGYNGTTDYTKGQGATSVINTDNKGSYDVDWQKGQKPIVTPVSGTSN